MTDASFAHRNGIVSIDGSARPERTFTISELAKEFGVTARALRFYEDKGLLSPARAGLSRVYSARDRARLRLVLQGKRVGLPLSDIRELLDLYEFGDGQRAQMAAALEKFRARLPALEAQRADLDAAIVSLKQGVAWLERQLAQPAGAATARAYEDEARRRLGEAS